MRVLSLSSEGGDNVARPGTYWFSGSFIVRDTTVTTFDGHTETEVNRIVVEQGEALFYFMPTIANRAAIEKWAS